MLSINWQQFGLKNNPYDTLPLVEGGDLQIDKAFVGRVKERKFLDGLFKSESKLCLTICGKVGVGKTSLANFHKFVWKYTKKGKRLFSFRREIEARKDLLDKRNFLLEIIGSVIREIRLLNPKLIEKDKFLNKLNQLVDISQSLGFSIGLSGGLSGLQLGGDIGREKSISQPIRFPITTLEQYFFSLVEFIKTKKIARRKFNGLIVHVNNFDIVLIDKDRKKQVKEFFNEIRDILQTSNVYFLFLGPTNFFKEIISTQPRVKSIFFQAPLMLQPLSKGEIIQAFEERMKLLKSDNIVDYIKPFEDEVIFKLYDLYDGDIRQIMTALRDILNQYSDKIAKPFLIDEAMLLLGRERLSRIESMSQLKTEQKKILLYLAKSDKFISQKDVALIFQKAQPNISGYYFKPLRQNGIIEEKKREGKVKYWGLTQEYMPLKYLLDSQKKIQKRLEKRVGQMTLF